MGRDAQKGKFTGKVLWRKFHGSKLALKFINLRRRKHPTKMLCASSTNSRIDSTSEKSILHRRWNLQLEPSRNVATTLGLLGASQRKDSVFTSFANGVSANLPALWNIHSKNTTYLPFIYVRVYNRDSILLFKKKKKKTICTILSLIIHEIFLSGSVNR